MCWNVLNSARPQLVHCHGPCLGPNSNTSGGQTVGDLELYNFVKCEILIVYKSVFFTWLNVCTGGKTSDICLCFRWLWSTQWRMMSTTSVNRSRITGSAVSVAINCSTTWRISALLRVNTCICMLMFRVWELLAIVLYLAISLDTLVMNTPGLARAILASACLAVLQQSATGVSGRPYFWLGTHMAASLLMSRRPSRTLETSRWGSQRTKPRPIRSMAARLSGVCGLAGVAGTRTRYIRARAVSLVRLPPRAIRLGSRFPGKIRKSLINFPKTKKFYQLLPVPDQIELQWRHKE